MGGTARVSVLVTNAWRVHALATEFATRGLTLSWEESISDGGYWVRTYYSANLVVLDTPSILDGSRMRLWFIVGGTMEDGVVKLAVGLDQVALIQPALTALGLAADLVDGPALRITGKGKLARLADLIGEQPGSATAGAWPQRAVKTPRPNRIGQHARATHPPIIGDLPALFD